MLFAAAKTSGENCVLVMLKKGKLRDEPPIKSFAIRIIEVSSLKEAEDLIFTAKFFLSSRLYLFSGEFFVFASRLRMLVGSMPVFVAIPIGFEIPLMVEFRSQPGSAKKAVGDALYTGLACCDLCVQNDNTTEQSRTVLEQAGLWNKRLSIWRGINPIRVTVSQALASPCSDFSEKIGSLAPPHADVLGVRRYIFLASRITKDDPTQSVAAKGSFALLRWLIDHSQWLAQRKISLVLIERDRLSSDFVRELLSSRSGSALQVIRLPELNLVQFIKVVDSAFIAVDTFDTDGSLRPHVTTSDVIARGVPLVTATRSASIAQGLLSDGLMGIFDGNSIREGISHLMQKTNEELFEAKTLRRSRIESHYSEFTDVFEAQTLHSFVLDRFRERQCGR